MRSRIKSWHYFNYCICIIKIVGSEKKRELCSDRWRVRSCDIGRRFDSWEGHFERFDLVSPSMTTSAPSQSIRGDAPTFALDGCDFIRNMICESDFLGIIGYAVIISSCATTFTHLRLRPISAY